MLRTLGLFVRSLIVVVFLATVGFGASQMLASDAASFCDTPPGSCDDDGDCAVPCAPLGGYCMTTQGINCCICYHK